MRKIKHLWREVVSTATNVRDFPSTFASSVPSISLWRSLNYHYQSHKKRLLFVNTYI